jgi:hypothetical protein
MNSKNNKIWGVLAITINLIAFFYKAIQGARAGWETLLPIVAVGVILTLVTIFLKRNAIAWVAVVTAVLTIVIFFYS